MFKLYKNRNRSALPLLQRLQPTKKTNILCKQSDPLDDDRRRMPKKVERPFPQCIYVKVATLKIIKKLIQKIVRSMCHEFFTIFDNNFLIILSEATLSLESHTILYVIVMVNLYCFLGLKSRCFCFWMFVITKLCDKWYDLGLRIRS